MLEVAAYIRDLNSAQPPAGDPAGQAYAHINLIKGVLKNTFPNMNGQVTASVDDLNNTLLKLRAPDTGKAIAFLNAGSAATTLAVTDFGLGLLGMANAAALSTSLNLDSYLQKTGGVMTGALSVPSITIGNTVTIRADAGNAVFEFGNGGSMIYDSRAKNLNVYANSKLVGVFAANGDFSANGNVSAGVTY